MDTTLSEDGDHEVGTAIQYLGVLLEVVRCVDEALESDNAHHALEVAELQMNRCQNVETS